MEFAVITAKQVFILFLLIFVGYVCTKAGVIRQEAKKAFSSLLVYVVAPGMVLNSYLMDFDPQVLSNLRAAFGLSALVLGLSAVLSILLTFRRKDSHRAIFQFACMFSNAGYMGFPLIQALFGAEGLMYASAFVTVFNLLLWTVGYAIVSGKLQPLQILHSICTTPVLYAVVIGLVVYLGRVPVPDLFKQPVELLGNMNTPLSMFITGMMIAGSNLPKMLHNREYLSLIGIRMLLLPAICIGLFRLLCFHGTVANVVLLLEACPTAAITAVFAVQFHHDEEFAAGAVVFTTLFSILSLPLCAMLLTAIL